MLLFFFFKRYFFFISCLIFFCAFPVLLGKSYIQKPISQTDLPELSSEMLEVDFWKSRLKNPDQVWLQKKAILDLNRNIRRKGYLNNPLNYSSVSVRLLKNYLSSDIALMRRYIKYDREGKRRRDPEFSQYLSSLIGYDRLTYLKKVNLRFGVVIRGANLRSFPTDEIMVRRPGDVFDIFVKSFLPVFSVTAIFFESADQRWYYVDSAFSRGWVRKENIVIFSKKEIAEWSQIKDHLNSDEGVVVDRKADIYQLSSSQDGKMKKLDLSLPMGTIVRLLDSSNISGYRLIRFPRNRKNKVNKNEAEKMFYAVKRDAVRNQFLNFTSANLLNQSFQFLGSRYEWGGGRDATDCSLFLYYVLRSFGILLPRSSVLQIKSLASSSVSLSELSQTLGESSPLTTLAYISGPNHIMLYLGRYRGKDFFIHSIWSFKDRTHEYLLSSVVISDLSLGKNHSYGSLAYKVKKIGNFLMMP